MSRLLLILLALAAIGVASAVPLVTSTNETTPVLTLPASFDLSVSQVPREDEDLPSDDPSVYEPDTELDMTDMVNDAPQVTGEPDDDSSASSSSSEESTEKPVTIKEPVRLQRSPTPLRLRREALPKPPAGYKGWSHKKWGSGLKGFGRKSGGGGKKGLQG